MMEPTSDVVDGVCIEAELRAAVAESRSCQRGEPAGYIPELRKVDPELISAAIFPLHEAPPHDPVITAGDIDQHRFTLQSSAKLVLLAGLLEELGPEAVFSRVGAEPSGSSFSSVARLETHGPHPANPLVNAGAIALVSLIPGGLEERLQWIDRWMERLCGAPLRVDEKVLQSETATGDRNRSIAFFLKAEGTLEGSVEEVLRCYFTLCSYEARVIEAAHLARVLASAGETATGSRVLSRSSAAAVLSVMATCGMYDESGTHLLNTGLPAKSGVSGIILAALPGRAGIAVASPRINERGGSVRGHLVLARLTERLGWHFALPPR